MSWGIGFALVGLLVLTSGAVSAHGGGLNSDGCHNDRKNGGYHCHRAPAARAPAAASFAPAQPGYGSHLDRDNDGVGCE